jgi:hypothetical protein
MDLTETGSLAPGSVVGAPLRRFKGTIFSEISLLLTDPSGHRDEGVLETVE